MTINVGDRIPNATLQMMGDKGPQPVKTDDYFKGRKVALFAVPGAFTPTCSNKHLPGFVQNADKLKQKGIDEIACVSVNDAFVMGAWGKDQQCTDKVTMLADGSGQFTKALGLDLDLTQLGLGVRSKRYSMLIEDGVVKQINIEQNPAEAMASGAERMLESV